MKKEAEAIFSGCENCDKIVMNVMTDFFLAAHGIAIGYLPNNVGGVTTVQKIRLNGALLPWMFTI